MIYVMSDIHGMYSKYKEMLELIHFSDSDTLYILGDMIDRGSESIKLIKDLMYRSNVYTLIGNHEAMAIRCLRVLMQGISEESISNMDIKTLNILSDWLYNGGEYTLSEFKKLNNEEKEEVMDYLYDLSLYEVVDINDKKFILVHGGLGNFDENKALDDYVLNEIVWERPIYTSPYYKDKNTYVVVGHTPTLSITGKPEIYHMNNIINIDCGACFASGRLACLCLDTMEEFYI